VLAPVASEMMALDGLQELLTSLQESNIRRAGLHLPGQTELDGILVAKVHPDQLELLDRIYKTLDENEIPHFGSLYVPYTTAGWKAPGARVPISVFKPDDAAAKAYSAVVDELMGSHVGSR
jgi:cellulose biosynthesis protein BcsQ